MFLGVRKLNISLVCISNSVFKVPKRKILNPTHYFIMKVPNKKEISIDRQTAKISALSSGNVNKYEFLTGKDALKKAATRCSNDKIWIFTFRQLIKSTNWHCKETVSKIRLYLWVW